MFNLKFKSGKSSSLSPKKLWMILTLASALLLYSSTHSETAIKQIETVTTPTLHRETKFNNFPTSQKIKLVKPLDFEGKDISGDGQFVIVEKPTRRPIIFQAISEQGEPLKNLNVFYEVVFSPSDSKKIVQVTPLSGRMVTDEDGFFRATIIPGEKEGKYAIVFFVKGTGEDFAFIEFVLNVRRENWGNWLLLWLFGGMGLFLLGMKISSEGLLKVTGAKLKHIISNLTRTPLLGVASGTLLTTVTESSSVTSSMLVSFVNAGLMTLRQAIGVLFGAAIGTTIIVQIISFNVSDYALPLIALGVVITLAFKSEKVNSVGTAIIGFGLIFYGMRVMQDIVSPLKEFPFFANAVSYFAGAKGWCLILSALFTATCHSSGATLGIAISLAMQGLINLDVAIPIIFGANIGTTATALMVSTRAIPEAKRVAWAHLIFKTTGVILVSPFISQIALIGSSVTSFLSNLPIPFGGDNPARQIANTHTILNVFWAALFLPFANVLEYIVKLIVPDSKLQTEKEVFPKYLNLNVDESPPIAIGSALREISRMGRFVEEMMRIIGDAFFDRKESLAVVIETKENKIDHLRFSLTQFLIKLTHKSLSQEESTRIVKLIFIVSDLENIGDIIYHNMMPLAQKMILNRLKFSEEGEKELKDLHKTVTEELSKTIIALTTSEIEVAKKVAENRKPIFRKADQLHLSHLRRFREGLQESVDTSTIHLDLINYLMRIEYFVSSIASFVCDHSRKHLEIDSSVDSITNSH